MKLLDSLYFIPMSLKKFPKSIGVLELKKGSIPHLFNTMGNQDYVGPIPDKKYSDPEAMSVGERMEFHKWYDERDKDANYDFQQEMQTYCRSDVDIVHKCILIFRKLFIKSTGIDPFESCVTIASACSLVYRTNFLK